MASNDLVKQISGLIDEKLDKFATGQLTEILDERFEKFEEKLEEKFDEKLGPIKLSIINIESTMKSYSDMYQVNDDNVRKIEKRVEVVEEKLNITPLEEHQLIPPSEFS